MFDPLTVAVLIFAWIAGYGTGFVRGSEGRRL